MQPNKTLRTSRWPWRRRNRRLGADAAFAKAMARSEFGRFYADDQQLQEVARSLARAQPRRTPKEPAHKPQEQAPPLQDEPRAKAHQVLWHQPCLREQRTKLAQAKARLLAAAKRRTSQEAT